ncbi:uncharacterized protein [Drosophila takahashii]|uniref:uncharacterized protein n=1 Tax=Drosophila takahashii TaxID=29030 RepID=UPI001CF856EE|nr:C-type lectin domain family 4 member M-like [Drosophila takahashii]
MLGLTYFSALLLIILVAQGAVVQSKDKEKSTSLLQDPQNQCGDFCLSKLHPMMDLIPETNSKLDRIHGEQQSIQMKLQAVQSTLEASVQTNADSQMLAIQQRLNRMEEKLMAISSDMKNQLQLLLTKMTDQQTSMQSQMDAQLLAVKKVLEDQKIAPEPLSSETNLNITEGQLPMTETKIENQPEEFQSTTENNHLLETQTTIKSNTIDPKFELVGSRYFYFGHDNRKSWLEAAETCHQMGGFLAAFKTEEELIAVMGKLESGFINFYWTGINDLKEDGQLISAASGKPATILKWREIEPTNSGPCVLLDIWGMIRNSCSFRAFFICQADNEF